MSRNQYRIRIERDRSTDEWLVVEHRRTGWSVLGRYDDEGAAHQHAQQEAHALQEAAAGR